MKSFRFPLERVRKWRAGQLELEKRNLSALIAERTALTEHVEYLDQECKRKETALIQATAVEGQFIGALDQYRAWVKSQIAILHARIAETDKQISAQQKRVLEAQRNFDLLGKLKDRAYADWRKAADAELENLAAEAYLAKWRPE